MLKDRLFLAADISIIGLIIYILIIKAQIIFK